MQNLLQGLKGIEILADDIIIYGTGDTELEGIEILADDIIIYGTRDTELDAIKEHNENLENLLRRLTENNCKLNKDKLKLCKNEVKFYGHYLTSNGLNPDYSKVEAIQNFPRPEDKKSLLRYLGMVNYLGRYIKNLSQATNNLRLLTHNETKWNWNQETEKEFNNIKKIISNIMKQNGTGIKKQKRNLTT
ncbi:hypothetical protein QE152_g38848 [Popillia japonica]|uniref:RNA-directed DNA polymerase n=1 Tax=Popillia japonica TaxID=7064 RepID=A0AAW1HVQ7_POPJA